MNATHPSRSESARGKLLDVALRVIREKGYHATSVDELCAAAGVTKGAFFHHFKSKEELAIAAADHWSAITGDLFAHAPYHMPADPLDRVLGYLDFRAALISGTLAEFTCLAGTMTQETFLTNPSIRDACFASISGHAQTLEADIEEVIAQYGVKDGVTAPSLALHTQAVLQGAFILAKAKDDPAIAVDSVTHLRRYIAGLFPSPTSLEK
ncbi:transcriptional regulator, TetR family [Sphingomonas sp. YR710]|uniref:TetR/AcrR family transcriptional regulator n=1 Tax=Sphingomonas sp. YR710 TaxID=1882773 RepID=UPI0008897FF0|nr:TetR/AcrR family transcriptional regulator [Sphingomonas sp. YR710]SDC12193.1 transcriptional regulator, TetR family [Sphingomonas sp. YR710]